MRFKTFFVVALVAAAAFFGSSTAFCETVRNHKEAGDLYLRTGETNLAIKEYEKALALNPASTAVSFNLAIAYYQSRNFKAAESILEKIVQQNPDDYAASYNLACLKLYRNDMEGARRCLEKAKSCCLSDPEFTPLIQNTIEFAEKLTTLDPQTRGALLLYFLTQNHIL